MDWNVNPTLEDVEMIEGMVNQYDHKPLLVLFDFYKRLSLCIWDRFDIDESMPTILVDEKLRDIMDFNEAFDPAVLRFVASEGEFITLNTIRKNTKNRIFSFWLSLNDA